MLGFAPEQPPPEPVDFTEWVQVDDILETMEGDNEDGNVHKRMAFSEFNSASGHKHGGGTSDASHDDPGHIWQVEKEVADNGGGQLSDKRNVYCKHNVVAGDSDPSSDADDHGELVAKPAEDVEKGDEGDDDRLSNKRDTGHKHSGGDNTSDHGIDADNRGELVAKPAEESAPKPAVATQGTPLGTFEATMYTATCEGCSGVTRYGLDVRSTIYSPKGLRVIAVDPSVIEPMTVVQIKFASGRTISAVTGDIGSAINGREIDILVGSRAKALDFGRQDVEVTIVD